MKIVKLPVILIIEALVVVGTIMKFQEKSCQVIALEEAPTQEDFDSIATTQPTTQKNLKQLLFGWSYNR